MKQEAARRAQRIESSTRRYRTAYAKHHAAVVAEAFPEPQHDQESNVGHLIKRMLINRLVSAAFDAGWVAAGKVVPSR